MSCPIAMKSMMKIGRKCRTPSRRAKAGRTDIDPGLFDFIEDVLLLRARGPLETEFVYRFQQFTSPVMAKGVEDTAFYCYNRMIGLNEVGGAPDRGGIVSARVSRTLHQNARIPSPHHDHALHPRHQTIRRCAGAPRGAHRNRRSMEDIPQKMVTHECAAQDQRSARSQHGVLPVSDDDWCVAHRARPADCIYGKGCSGGKSSKQAGRSKTRSSRIL